MREERRKKKRNTYTVKSPGGRNVPVDSVIGGEKEKSRHVHLATWSL